uniref:Uncharacterized protein n=1 Tax=Anguilla anguilla TaxID=7936 RepID=A0A0E9WSW4_ANGAN
MNNESQSSTNLNGEPFVLCAARSLVYNCIYDFSHSCSFPKKRALEIPVSISFHTFIKFHKDAIKSKCSLKAQT